MVDIEVEINRVLVGSESEKSEFLEELDFMDGIRPEIPVYIFKCRDDPLIGFESIDGYNIPNVNMIETENGGHIGYHQGLFLGDQWCN